MTNPQMITPEALDAVYLFIAEIMGHKTCTIAEKLQAGKDCYAERRMPDYNDDDLNEYIWVERLYDELDRWNTFTGLGGKAEDFHWSVPIELDASASMLSYMGALLGDKRLLQATNSLVIDDQLNDPWKIDGLSRNAVKAAFMPRLYASSQPIASLWKKGKFEYTQAELKLANEENMSGMFGTADAFKEFVVRNCNPKEVMKVHINGESFEIRCNRWKQIGEVAVSYDLWDSDTQRIRRVTNTKTKKVADLEQFRRYFQTLLIHNLDSQVMNTVSGLVYNKYGFCIDIHDAMVIPPAAAADARRWYADEITLIFKNRKKILSEFFTSIGITAASREAWDRVMEGVVPVDEDFECSGWALK